MIKIMMAGMMAYSFKIELLMSNELKSAYEGRLLVDGRYPLFCLLAFVR